MHDSFSISYPMYSDKLINAQPEMRRLPKQKCNGAEQRERENKSENVEDKRKTTKVNLY